MAVAVMQASQYRNISGLPLLEIPMKTMLAPISLLLLLTTAVAQAAWKYPTKVRFESGGDFSPWTTANVAFAMGGELNRVSTAGGKFNVEDGRFAVVPMSDGTFNVVRLSGYAPCGSSFTSACLLNGHADGFDGRGRHWQFCANETCQ
ncbi:MAG TPA: hypothetical protein VGM36_12335 [Rhizomicrobium sp.]|jgi:hypothetical protein